jgi:hypothetical protein
MGGLVIVEIGTGIHGPMSGDSMRIWVSRTKAARIIAVDLEPAHRGSEIDAGRPAQRGAGGRRRRGVSGQLLGAD